MTFKISAKIKGLPEFKRALQKASEVALDLAPSLQVAANATIVPEAKANVYDQFETTGDFPARIRTRTVGPNRAEIVVWAIYAAVHEYGGTFTITPKQRAFFWAKWSETRDPMWRALALSVSYTIPARPYMRPAVDSKKELFAQFLAVAIANRLARTL